VCDFEVKSALVSSGYCVTVNTVCNLFVLNVGSDVEPHIRKSRFSVAVCARAHTDAHLSSNFNLVSVWGRTKQTYIFMQSYS
jgi:hypothetical protein